jgi:putative hydrolase
VGEQHTYGQGFPSFLEVLAVAFFERTGSPLDENRDREELEKLLRRMFESGSLNPEELSKVAGAGLNPKLLGQLFGQVQAMMSDSDGPVNWELATKTAVDIAKEAESQPSEVLLNEIQNSFDIAQLWLSEQTDFTNSQPLKLLSRTLWVQDAIPLFKDLAEPVAASMSRALSDNLNQVIPEELVGMIGPATKFLENAGAAMFAAQLGQSVGKLSENVLSSTEIGIPLSNRPGLVGQNVESLLKDLETPKSEVLIYLAIRELAISSLYASNRWLRDQIATQVSSFAAGLKIDPESIQNLAQQIDPSDPTSFNLVIESGGLITPRTADQEQVLTRIETMLALIEGWADAVSLAAASRLPGINQVFELIRRRQAVGAAQKTFATLLGLELRPRLQREAMAMWQKIAEQVGTGARDEIWRHPDLLPTADDIQDPSAFLARLGGGDDDFDSELNKLLGN